MSTTEERARQNSQAPGRWFEDFSVGERFISGTRVVDDTDLSVFTRLSGDDHAMHRGEDAVLQGPFGMAVAMGLLQSLGLHGTAVQALLDTHWFYRLPVRVGDVLYLEVVIVRCRRTRGRGRGVVTRHMRLVDMNGEVVQEGITSALLAARSDGPDPVGRAFGTVAWGQGLVEHLGPEFGESLTTWDGTIGLRAGTDEVHLRVYRGKVIEVSERAPHGATFTVEANELTWTELVEDPVNDLMRYGMSGRLTVRGDGYEYLRLTTALVSIIDAARAIAKMDDA